MSKEKHHRDWLLRRCCGAVAACILTLVVVVGFITLVIYLALHPTKPSFYLQDVTVRSIDVSDPALSAALQVTIASRNPNDRVGIYYMRLDVLARYRSEPITVPVSLPSTYQGHKDVSVWSPVLSGDTVPVAQYVADAMKQDFEAGYVLLNVVVDGRVKWKVGSWSSGSYPLFVNCPALLVATGNPPNATNLGPLLKLAQPAECTVDV